jgi:hypothetical protein
MVKVCLNPDCQQLIPDDHNYCDEVCLRWHIKIKKKNHSNLNLKPNPKSILLFPSGCKLCREKIKNENYFAYHGFFSAIFNATLNIRKLRKLSQTMIYHSCVMFDSRKRF